MSGDDAGNRVAHILGNFFRQGTVNPSRFILDPVATKILDFDEKQVAIRLVYRNKVHSTSALKFVNLGEIVRVLVIPDHMPSLIKLEAMPTLLKSTCHQNLSLLRLATEKHSALAIIMG